MFMPDATRDTARAMSQENVERAREGYAALALAIGSRDLDAYFSEYMHPEVEWVPLEGALDVDVSVGHKAVKGRLMTMFSVFGEVDFELEEVIDADDQVLVVVRDRMVGRAQRCAGRGGSPGGLDNRRRQGHSAANVR